MSETPESDVITYPVTLILIVARQSLRRPEQDVDSIRAIQW